MQKNKLFYTLLLSLWLALALFPWGTTLTSAPLLRFLLALLVFLLPGILSYLVLSHEDRLSPTAVLAGFVLSLFVTGLLGLIARLLALNFNWIRAGFALWGTFILLPFILGKIWLDFSWKKPSRWQAFFLLLTLAGAAYFSSLARPPLIHDDAFTYNALLYYYRHAPALTFDFPDALDRLEIPRFWLAYWPLAEALLSGLSGVDGLIITGIYLPSALAALSFLAIFTLASTLGLPQPAAGLAVLAQGFSLMRLTRYNHPGNLFFQRLTEDKVVAAFVISLVLILLIVQYLEKPSTRRLMLVVLSALAMVFTHPIQFGMTCMIAGVYGLPSLFEKALRPKYLLLILALALVVLIPYTFRFSGGEYSQTLSFSLADVKENEEFARFGVRRIDILAGTRFYGVSHYLTRGLPYEVSLAASLLALYFFRRQNAASYILAAFLTLGVSMFPYTGWLVGMFTTPFQLWRLTWLMPFGISFGFLAWALFDLGTRLPRLSNLLPKLQSFYYLVAYAALIALVFYVRPWMAGNLPTNNLDLLDIYTNYARVGARLNDLSVASGRIIGGAEPTVNAILPSLTLKFTPIVFRVQGSGEQTALWKSLMVEEATPQQRLAQFDRYGIDYLLLRGEPAWLPAFAATHPTRVTLLFRDQRLSLYHIIP